MPEQPLTRVVEFDPEDEYRPEPEPEPGPPAWMDGSLRIGIHTSIAGGYLNALESAHKLGCNALQIFPLAHGCRQAGRLALRKWMPRRFVRAAQRLDLGRWLFMQII